jgi:hypothetical protein
VSVARAADKNIVAVATVFCQSNAGGGQPRSFDDVISSQRGDREPVVCGFRRQ